MKKLTKAEVRELHQEAQLPHPDGQTRPVATASLDPDRNWVRVTCPACSREHVVELHPGAKGGQAECGSCGGLFVYGDYDPDEQLRATLAAEDAADAADVSLTASDRASAAETSS